MAKRVVFKKKAPDKMSRVMGEYGAGKLHSGSKSGPVVTNHKQAVAIGLSEQRAAEGKPTTMRLRKKA